MSPTTRQRLNNWIACAARLVGSKIRDVRTGEVLGTGFLWSWRGKVQLIGYRGTPVIPVFQTQERLTYWRQTIGFTAHPEPDFEHVAGG